MISIALVIGAALGVILAAWCIRQMRQGKEIVINRGPARTVDDVLSPCAAPREATWASQGKRTSLGKPSSPPGKPSS